MCLVDPTHPAVPGTPPPTLNSRFTSTFTQGAVKKCRFVVVMFIDSFLSCLLRRLLSDGTGIGGGAGVDDDVEEATSFN